MDGTVYRSFAYTQLTAHDDVPSDLPYAMTKNPILIIDDDQEDLDLIRMWRNTCNLNNLFIIFQAEASCKLTLWPFLIICDVHLLEQDGFAIKKSISKDPDLKYKSVPFIFWSTDASEKQIQFAYDLPAQGFFFKPSNFDDLQTFLIILNYWKKASTLNA